MARATYVLEVDWDNNGSFGGAEDNITADFLSIESRRGRDYASQLTGRAAAGRMVATLKNLSGKYSSFNADSPIAGNILPGRKVRLRTTAPVAADLWTGYLVRIVPAGSVGGVPTATLEAGGPIGRINSKRITPAAQASQLTGTIVGAILDDAGWPAGDRDLADGQTTVARWFAGRVDALNAIREIEETELGFFFEAANGDLVYEDRHTRLKAPHTESQATFSDEAGSTLGYRSIEQSDPLREIYNDTVASVAPLEAAGAVSVLWTLDEQPTIEAGASRSWTAEYPNVEVDPNDGAYVETWTTPVASTDVTVTGVDIGDIAIAAVKKANSMAVTLTNNGSATATVTLLQARGDPVKRKAEVRITAEDTDSQDDYGIRTYRLPGPWIPNTAEAVDFVNYVLSRYKDPLPVLTMSLPANKSDALLTQALTRDISDRVTIVADSARNNLGIDDDFFIEAVSHRISQSGQVHETFFELSDASGDAGYFTIGVLGIGAKLAY